MRCVKKRISFILSLFLLVFVTGNAQYEHKRDSLLKLLTLPQSDSARSLVYIKICAFIQDTEPDKAIPYVDTALTFAERSKNPYSISNAYNQYGIVYFNKGALEKSLSYYLKSLKIREELKDEKLIAGSYNNIGRIYEHLGNYPLALDYYQKALDINRRAGNESWENINLNNMGNVYGRQAKYEEAKKYFLLSYDLSKKIKDDRSLALACSNLSLVYSFTGTMDKAIEMQLMALEIRKKMQNLAGISASYQALAEFSRQTKDLKKGVNYCLESIEYAKRSGDLDAQSLAYGTLAELYFDLKDFKGSAENYKKYNTIKDSLFKTESTRTISEMQTRYDTEKKENEINLLKSKQEVKDQELSRQRVIIYSVAGGLFLLLLLALLLVRSNKVKQKANAELAVAYRQIEEKNKDITDSIRYAKRIQDTILPPSSLVKQLLPSSFILFRPRDIVSGDFYWMHHAGEFTFLAAVDCTGHGVPGAFMSIVASNLLNKAVVEKNITDPGKILDLINTELSGQTASEQDQFHFRDGMDISIVKLYSGNKRFEFAGANNDVWVLRSNDLLTLKSDKMAVDGVVSEEKKFTTNSFDLKMNDRIYLFSDGFADQFGGDKGKKLKYKNLQKLILDTAPGDLASQKIKLDEFLIKWMGDHEQVDDILIIGISI